jgi:hypothetical protein
VIHTQVVRGSEPVSAELPGNLAAAAVAFRAAQSFFNRTLIARLSTTAPSTDSSFTRTHQGALLGWLPTSAAGLSVDLMGSLWLAYQAF